MYAYDEVVLVLLGETPSSAPTAVAPDANVSAHPSACERQAALGLLILLFLLTCLNTVMCCTTRRHHIQNDPVRVVVGDVLATPLPTVAK